MLVEIVQNLAIISFSAIGVYYAFLSSEDVTAFRGQVLLGGIFFLVAFTVTMTPIHMPDGATIDARAGPVITAGMVGGPVAGFIAALGGAIARSLVGGSFSFSGVLVFLLYAIAGSLVWVLWRPGQTSLLRPAAVLAGVVLSLVSAALMFFVISPREMALRWISDDYPFIAAANTASILVSALVIGVAFRVARNTLELRRTLSVLELAKTAGGFGIWQWNPRTRVVHWDARNLELHGVDPGAFNNTYEDWANTVHPDDLPRVAAAFHQMFEDDTHFDTEYRVVLKDGMTRYLKGDAIAVHDHSGAVVQVVGVNFDLSELRQREEQLQSAQQVAGQAQRLDTIGKMTGGVAHDFNNLLAVIHGNLEILLDDAGRTHPLSDDQKDLVTGSISAARRGAELTRNMLAFARKSELQPVRLNVNSIVEETEGWLRRTIPERITIETRKQDDLWDIEADRTGLQSALVNVIVNARDAMPDGGRLEIVTSQTVIDDKTRLSTRVRPEPGRYVVVSVADTGQGIPPSTLARVFDPFFTTKEVGVGTGLGLSMVQGFVNQSGGFVDVKSAEGKGSTFALYFPAIAQSGAASDDTPGVRPAAAAVTVSEARLLVVEDQLEVLGVLVRILQAEGYAVETASSGDAALTLFEQDRGFDLLISDIVMPGRLQGPDLARELRKQVPELPVILLSGYASEAKVHGNGLRPDDIRLMKPISRVELLAAVEQSLAPRQAAEA